MKYLAIIFGLMIAPVSMGCSFDLDCGIGSHCVKKSGALEGVCIGGSSPGNDYDDDPYQARWNEDESTGQTCGDDFDCGLGAECVKSSGNFEGVCM